MGIKATVSTKSVTGGLAALDKKLKLLGARKAYVKVGLLGSKDSRDGGELTNPALGSIHEYGTSKIPARPFIMPPFMAEREANVAILTRGYRAALAKNEPDAFIRVLRALGQKMVAGIKRYVTAGDSPLAPNAPETVRRKGSDRPLVDTGQLIRSVDYVVVE